MGGANALTWDRSANEMAMNDRVVIMVGVGENLDLFTKKNTPY